MTFKEWWQRHEKVCSTSIKATAEQAYKAGADNRYPTAAAYEAVCAALHRREDELQALRVEPKFTAQQVLSIMADCLKKPGNVLDNFEQALQPKTPEDSVKVVSGCHPNEFAWVVEKNGVEISWFTDKHIAETLRIGLIAQLKEAKK
jgi:hypothetical protein